MTSPWRRDRLPTPVFLGFPGGSAGKESACSAGDLGSIPGSGRSPGGGHGNPLQYSCLENPFGERSMMGYSPRGCKESDTMEWLSTSGLILWETEYWHQKVGTQVLTLSMIGTWPKGHPNRCRSLYPQTLSERVPSSSKMLSKFLKYLSQTHWIVELLLFWRT